MARTLKVHRPKAGARVRRSRHLLFILLLTLFLILFVVSGSL